MTHFEQTLPKTLTCLRQVHHQTAIESFSIYPCPHRSTFAAIRRNLATATAGAVFALDPPPLETMFARHA